MMSTKRKSKCVPGSPKKVRRELDFLLFWLLDTSTYISSIPEDHKYISNLSEAVKRDLKLGDRVAMIGDVKARLLFRGTCGECVNKEKFVDSYMVAHEGEMIDSDTILDLLNDDEFIPPPSEEEPVSPASSPIREMNPSPGREAVTTKEDAESATFDDSEVDNVPPTTEHVFLSETLRLLRVIIEQNEVTNDLLRTFLSQRRISPSSELIDHAGKRFTISEISHANPSVFAISLLKRLLGREFKNLIIEPKGNTSFTPLRPEGVEILKEALNISFPFHSYNEVRRTINQRARDMRNREKRLQRIKDE